MVRGARTHVKLEANLCYCRIGSQSLVNGCQPWRVHSMD